MSNKPRCALWQHFASYRQRIDELKLHRLNLEDAVDLACATFRRDASASVGGNAEQALSPKTSWFRLSRICRYSAQAKKAPQFPVEPCLSVLLTPSDGHASVCANDDGNYGHSVSGGNAYVCGRENDGECAATADRDGVHGSKTGESRVFPEAGFRLRCLLPERNSRPAHCCCQRRTSQWRGKRHTASSDIWSCLSSLCKKLSGVSSSGDQLTVPKWQGQLECHLTASFIFHSC